MNTKRTYAFSIFPFSWTLLNVTDPSLYFPYLSKYALIFFFKGLRDVRQHVIQFLFFISESL